MSREPRDNHAWFENRWIFPGETHSSTTTAIYGGGDLRVGVGGGVRVGKELSKLLYKRLREKKKWRFFFADSIFF